MKRGSRHSPEHAELALLLRDVRLEAGLSQLDVAVALGDRPQSYISAIEVGLRGIDLVQARELATIYQIPFIRLIERFEQRLADRETERRPPRRPRAR